MKTTQCERILKYIEDFGSITSLQAVRDLSCMRLASRINDLKRMGIPVRKRSAMAKNRYGETVHFAEYYMDGVERKVEEPISDGTNPLKAARLAAGLKLTEAARELQKVNRWVDVPLLSKMENGYCKPTEEVLLRMAQIYGISPSLLRDGYFIPNEENGRENPFANDENTQ